MALSEELLEAIAKEPGLVEGWRILLDNGIDLRLNPFAIRKLQDDLAANPKLLNYLNQNSGKWDSWRMIYESPYSHDPDVLSYVDNIKSSATLGNASSTNYRNNFLNAFPEQQFGGDGFVVHHAIEQQVFTKYPGLFTEAEIHSIENLRGISPEINGPLHLSNIRKEWNDFYNQFPDGVFPTKAEVLEKATEIDNMFGNLFTPPIR